jgi:hypothetical protein
MHLLKCFWWIFFEFCMIWQLYRKLNDEDEHLEHYTWSCRCRYLKCLWCRFQVSMLKFNKVIKFYFFDNVGLQPTFYYFMMRWPFRQPSLYVTLNNIVVKVVCVLCKPRPFMKLWWSYCHLGTFTILVAT